MRQGTERSQDTHSRRHYAIKQASVDLDAPLLLRCSLRKLPRRGGPHTCIVQDFRGIGIISTLCGGWRAFLSPFPFPFLLPPFSCASRARFAYPTESLSLFPSKQGLGAVAMNFQIKAKRITVTLKLGGAGGRGRRRAIPQAGFGNGKGGRREGKAANGVVVVV